MLIDRTRGTEREKRQTRPLKWLDITITVDRPELVEPKEKQNSRVIGITYFRDNKTTKTKQRYIDCINI